MYCEAYEELEVRRPLVLNLDIRWRRVVTFALWPLYHRGKIRLYPLYRILEAAWDTLEKRKVFCLCRESNHSSSAIHPVAWSLRQIRYPRSLSWSVCYVSFAEVHHASQLVHVCVCICVCVFVCVCVCVRLYVDAWVTNSQNVHLTPFS